MDCFGIKHGLFLFVFVNNVLLTLQTKEGKYLKVFYELNFTTWGESNITNIRIYRFHFA